jgi:hypothetical protein
MPLCPRASWPGRTPSQPPHRPRRRRDGHLPRVRFEVGQPVPQIRRGRAAGPSLNSARSADCHQRRRGADRRDAAIPQVVSSQDRPRARRAGIAPQPPDCEPVLPCRAQSQSTQFHRSQRGHGASLSSGFGLGAGVSVVGATLTDHQALKDSPQVSRRYPEPFQERQLRMPR